MKSVEVYNMNLKEQETYESLNEKIGKWLICWVLQCSYAVPCLLISLCECLLLLLYANIVPKQIQIWSHCFRHSSFQWGKVHMEIQTVDGIQHRSEK